MKNSLYITIFFIFFLCSGCAQRINADVSATVEESYDIQGQSVSIGPLPKEGEVITLPENITTPLKQALLELGYVSAENKPADVHVRIYWQSFGPYVTYKENPLWDFGPWGRGPWRQPKVIKEEKYLRTLIIEAWANKLQQDEKADTLGLAPFLQKSLTYKEALAYLPKEPARLLWRVEAKSLGNLSSAEKVLPELLNAALPWMARSVDVRLMVQGDETREVVNETNMLMIP